MYEMVNDSLGVDGPLLLKPTRHGDQRGYFSEIFREDGFAKLVPGLSFVQDNHSRSAAKGTLRGLHFQRPPMAQSKLVRVVRGAVLDVAVDVRSGSSTYGRHVAVELSDENGLQFFIPQGFLHGFCTLTDDVDFLYKVDNYYSPEHDGAVTFDDPDLGIRWPFEASDLIVSAKDRSAPRLCDLSDIFPHD
jgi:dTDP-4-dehydrorhamnose 3,5-epimerase